MIENFSDDLERIFKNSTKLLFEKRQRKFTLEHFFYGFFSDSIYKNLFENKIDIETVLNDLYDIINSKEEDDPLEELDLSIETKEVVKMSLFTCMTAGNSKITPFDLIFTALSQGFLNEFALKHNIDSKLLNKVKKQMETSKPKTVLKQKSVKKDLTNNEKKDSFSQIMEDKNSVKHFITNLSLKVKNTPNLIKARQDIIDEMIHVLIRKEKSNPLLIGKPGVGKTTLIESLAQLINEGKVPLQLKDKEIYEINLNSLLSGTNFRGDFEKRVENIINLIKENKNAILFIDEIHCIKGLGSSGANKNDLDLSNVLKPYLSSGELSCIGSTTFEEYKNSIENDKALDRRFKIVNVKEPSMNETINILKYKIKDYEKFYKIKVPEQLVIDIVAYSNRYINKSNFPDKAFDVLDMSCAMAVFKNKKILNLDNILDTISKITGIKKDQIDNSDKQILSLETSLCKKIFGQNKAIKSIVDKIIVSKSGLQNENKPLASFLLIGPTGVGKTEVVNEISSLMNMNLLRLDMSEYAEKGSSSKLIGTSAGYVGYEDGGKLTEFVNHNPHSIILFDEIEKADYSIYNLFLQILDYGKISDGSGKEIDFRNCMIFMTSNSGTEELYKKSIGFKSEYQNSNMEKIVNKTFSPEFKNRISKIIYFEKLESETMYLLAKKHLELLEKKLSNKGINISFSDSAIDEIVKNGFDEKFGARPLERYIDDNITLLISKKILADELKKGEFYNIDFNNGWLLL